MKGDPVKLSASQQKTLDYVTDNGPVMLDVSGRGYSERSARSLVRMGLLFRLTDLKYGWDVAGLLEHANGSDRYTLTVGEVSQ
jgi:hypothetical protein